MLGLLIWLTGWRWHRFWTVAAATAGAGLYGMVNGQHVGAHAIAVGTMLALSAGLLALELARVAAFFASGLTSYLGAASLLPNVQEPAMFFLGGGLAGLLFYRVCVMSVTSFLGALIAGHAGMLLGESLGRFDAVSFAREYPLGISIGVGLVTLLGLAVQGSLARRAAASDAAEADGEKREKQSRWFRRRQATDVPADVRALREVFAKKE